MRRFGIVFTAVVFFSLLAASQAHADETNWTGTTGDWHDPLNWDNGVPTISNEAYIDNGGIAQISADAESYKLCAGYSGYYHSSGAVEQTGGTHTVSGNLLLGRSSGSSGTYNLSAGELSTGTELIGHRYGTGEFNQTGGVNRASVLELGQNTGSSGTYNLGGTGELSVGSEYIGNHQGTGEFNQTGGSNTVGYLFVKDDSSYTLSSGTLTISDNAEVNGSFHFTDGDWTLNVNGGLANFENGVVDGAGSASFNSATNTLTIFPTGFDPVAQFGSYNALGLVHAAGSTLVISAGEGFAGHGWINDHVQNSGNIVASGGSLDFRGGLTISEGGTLDSSNYNFAMDNGATVTIAASGGQLLAGHEYIGCGGTGTLNQNGGSNTVGSLTLGDELVYDDGPPPTFESIGIYNLGAGELLANYEQIGRLGTGEFNQTGGTHTVGNYLRLGYYSGSSGTYNLSAGELSVNSEYIGYEGTGEFNQTGGINSVRYLSINAASTYTFSSGTLIIKEGGSISGTIDFDHNAGLLSLLGGIMDIQDAALANTGSALFETLVNSLTILPAGFDPATAFGYTDIKGICYTPGMTMIVYEGQSYTGHYDFNDPLEIRGTLIASGGVFGFKDSLTISNGGTFNTGTETLTLQDGETITIAASGGTLIAPEAHIGYGGDGIFNQEGGTVIVSGSLHLAYDALFIKATYNLNHGELATTDLIVGDGQGQGEFNQSGGTLSVSGTLDITSVLGVYNLDGGTVEAHDVFLAGKGIFNITNSDAYIKISGSLTLQDDAAFMAVPGTTIHMTGSDFENTSTSLNNLGGLQNTTFIFEDSSDADTFEIASYDYGLIEANFYGNFGLEGLILDGSYSGTLQLLDAHVNFTGLGPSTQSEALYVKTLVLGGHATLDLNGYNIYAMEFTNYGGEVLNGEIQALSTTYIPEPATLLLLAPALLGFAGVLRRKLR